MQQGHDYQEIPTEELKTIQLTQTEPLQETKPLLDELLSDNILQAILLGNTRQLMMEIEYELHRPDFTDEDPSYLNAKYLDLSIRQNYPPVDSLLKLLAVNVENTPQLEKKHIYLLVACIFHNTPSLFAKLLSKLVIGEFSPKKIFQLYWLAMHLNRDEFFVKLAPLNPPPEIFRLGYLHQYFDHLATATIELLWNPLTPSQRKSAINGIFLSTNQIECGDLKLPESIKRWIKTQEDQGEDFGSFCEAKDTELFLTPVSSIGSNINLRNLCLFVDNEEYVKVIAALSEDIEDDPAIFLRQKLKNYVRHTSPDELKPESDIFKFMAFLDGSVLTHIERLSQYLTEQDFKFCVSQYRDIEEEGEFGLQSMLLIQGVIKNEPLERDLWDKISRVELIEEKEIKGTRVQPILPLSQQISSNLASLMSSVEIEWASQILGVSYFENQVLSPIITDLKNEMPALLPSSAWKIITDYLPPPEQQAILDYFSSPALAFSHLRKIAQAEQNLIAIRRLMAEVRATEDYPATLLRFLKKYVKEVLVFSTFTITFPTSFASYNIFPKVMADFANSPIWQMCIEIGYYTEPGYKGCRLPSNQTSIPLNQTQSCDQFCAEEVEPVLTKLGFVFLTSLLLAAPTSILVIPSCLYKIFLRICCKIPLFILGDTTMVSDVLIGRFREQLHLLRVTPPEIKQQPTNEETIRTLIQSLKKEEEKLKYLLKINPPHVETKPYNSWWSWNPFSFLGRQPSRNNDHEVYIPLLRRS